MTKREQPKESEPYKRMWEKLQTWLRYRTEMSCPSTECTIGMEDERRLILHEMERLERANAPYHWVVTEVAYYPEDSEVKKTP